MGVKLPVGVRIAVCWVAVVLGPFGAAYVVLIGSREKESWPFYAEAAILIGAWVYFIILLRRFRREQRELDSTTHSPGSGLTDEAVLASIQRGFGGPAYRLSSIVIADDKYDIRFRITGDSRTFGISIALPSASEAPPWVYTTPEDADDWATMLKIWMDEEIPTGTSTAATTNEGGVNYFEVAPYGFRRSDPGEHSRLLRR
jgi:hypothetical protein